MAGSETMRSVPARWVYPPGFARDFLTNPENKACAGALSSAYICKNQPIAVRNRARRTCLLAPGGGTAYIHPR